MENRLSQFSNDNNEKHQELFCEHPTQEFLDAKQVQIKEELNKALSQPFTSVMCIIVNNDKEKRKVNTQCVTQITRPVDKFALMEAIIQVGNKIIFLRERILYDIQRRNN